MSAFPLPALRTTLVNTFSCELILSFLFSNTLFPYKSLKPPKGKDQNLFPKENVEKKKKKENSIK